MKRDIEEKPEYLSREMTKKRLLALLNHLKERNKASAMVDLILTYDVLLSDREFKNYQQYLLTCGQLI